MTKKVDLLNTNARLWASKLYRQHGSAALTVLDKTGSRSNLTSADRKALAATRSELVRIIDNATKIASHKASLSPIRRLLFRLMYKGPGS